MIPKSFLLDQNVPRNSVMVIDLKAVRVSRFQTVTSWVKHFDGGEKSRGGGRGGRNGVRLIRLDFTRFEVTLFCKPHDQKLCRRKKILRDCFWRAANLGHSK